MVCLAVLANADESTGKLSDPSNDNEGFFQFPKQDERNFGFQHEINHRDGRSEELKDIGSDTEAWSYHLITFDAL